MLPSQAQRPPAQRAEAEHFEEVPALPADLLAAGKGIQRSGTRFVTAVAVQKPRDLDKIVKAIDKEAEFAGDSFWYGWAQGGERIEGPSIGLANSLAREWTNNAVTCDLQENPEAFYITATFIDLEKGSQMERVFRQRKSAVQGKYDSDRKLDIALQIGQSKAIRNVIVNSVPRWLVDRAIEKAKAAVAAKIDPQQLEKHRQEVIKFFGAHKVTVEQLVAKAKRAVVEWTTRDIADFSADAKALKAGEVSIGDLFPVAEVKTAAPSGPIDLKDLPPTGFAPAAAPEPLITPDTDGAPTAEEQAEIKRREIYESKPFKCSKCSTFACDTPAEAEAHSKAAHGGPAAPPAKAPPKSPPAGGGSLFK